MVVAIPPTRVANPTGIKMREAEDPVRKHTLIKIGRNKTTIGVLLTKADKTPPRMSVTNKAADGAALQNLARYLPIGSSAPVTTRPWPTTMRAQTATNASCPNP
jgi:hypothetical protein